jgi:hypothetical protein
MKRKRSRLALIGVLALALCVAVGLMAGSAVGAKKKGKKKSAKQVTATSTAVTNIPPAPNGDQVSFTSIPLTVGKKAKGKLVSGSSVTVTFSITEPGFAGAGTGDTGHLGLELTAPNGRSLFLTYPDDHDVGAIGPVTLSPNTPNEPCIPNTPPPPPPCADPEDVVGPPYAGTLKDLDLAFFTGVPARGTWTFKVLNGLTADSFTVGPVSLRIGLQNKPK